jgi:hypothetical protein
MKLQRIPDLNSGKIIKEVFYLVKNRDNLIHYKSDESILEKRLNFLYSQIILCLKYNNFSQLNKYAEKIAVERFTAGFSILEVLTVINIFQTIFWKYISLYSPQKDILSNIAIISSIFGELKDEIACNYVNLSEKNREKIFRTESLFEGTERAI